MNTEEVIAITHTVFFGDRFSRTPREIDEAYTYIENVINSKNTIYELKDRLMSQVKWEACDCGCPNKRTPADSRSVSLIRLVQQLEIAINDNPSKEYNAAH